MGHIFTSYCIKGELKPSTVKGGIETMIFLTEWYRANSGGPGVGFFQIGGGISPDLRRTDDVPGPGVGGDALLGLFLPDFGFDHLLRFLFRRRTQRKDYLG